MYNILFFLKARLQEENIAAKEEIKALIKQIEAEQGNLSQYTDRQAIAATQKANLEVVLVDTGKKLTEMEQARADATAEKKALEAENQIDKVFFIIVRSLIVKKIIKKA